MNSSCTLSHNETAELYFLKGIQFCVNYLNTTQSVSHDNDSNEIMFIQGMLYTGVFLVYLYEFEWDNALRSAWNITDPSILSTCRCFGRHFRLCIVIYQCYHQMGVLKMMRNYVELSLFILLGDFFSKVLGSYYVSVTVAAQKE